MKTLYLHLLAPVIVAAQAAGITIPGTLVGTCLEVDLNPVQVCESEGKEPPGTEWEQRRLSPFIICFTEESGNSFTTMHPANRTRIGTPLAAIQIPDICVSYSPFTNGESKGVVQLEHDDFFIQITLTFHKQDKNGMYHGSAEVEERAAGTTTYYRGARFYTRKIQEMDYPLTLPEDRTEEGLSEEAQSELQRILEGLKQTSQQKATTTLYRKRLLMLLPLILERGDVNLTTPATKGNTALHYACALGHTELVRLLVQAGADTEARTDKGALPADCVSGSDSSIILSILQGQ